METGNPYAAPQAGDVHGATASAQPLATAGARFLARFLDGVIEIAPIALGMVLAVAMSSEDSPALVPMALGYLAFLGFWIYQTVRLIKTGQTLGKKWAGVKVVAWTAAWRRSAITSSAAWFSRSSASSASFSSSAPIAAACTTGRRDQSHRRLSCA